MGRTIRRIALLLLLAGSLAAQADERLYDIEVIIFTQQHGDLVAERWPMAREPAVFPRYADLADGGTPSAQRFVRGDGRLQLGQAVRQLESSGRYDVLLHTGWRQPGLDRDRAAALTIPIGSPAPAPSLLPATGDRPLEAIAPEVRPPEGLSGYLRVFVERFIHLEANLRLVDPALGVQRRHDHLPLFGEDQAPVIVMEQRRRMRSGELHYLDHPHIGILVRVNRADD